MKEKARKINVEVGETDFKCISNWVSNTLKRHDFTGVRAYGEGGEKTEIE